MGVKLETSMLLQCEYYYQMRFPQLYIQLPSEINKIIKTREGNC